MGVDDVLCTQSGGERVQDSQSDVQGSGIIVGLIFPHIHLASDAMEYSNRLLARC